MKRTLEFAACIIVLMIAALATPVSAETLTATVALSSANEVPPTAANATGTSIVTITVNRDSAGNIIGGSINFLTTFNFPSGIIVNGHHIHEGLPTANGQVRFDTGLGGNNTATFATGSGTINLTAQVADLGAFRRLIANPPGFYVNLHTSVNPGGAIRGQITQLVETQAGTVALSAANEVPPVAGSNATGTATITVNPTRDATGNITGGAVTFTVTFNFPGGVTITGLHIHEAALGVNGAIVIDPGINTSNQIVSSTGTGTINLTLQRANISVLQRFIANPSGFYVNLHTTVSPGGAIRGQLSTLTTPILLQQLSAYSLPTNNTNSPAALSLTGSNFDPVSRVLINGQTVNSSYDFLMGQLSATVPANLLSSAGTLQVQVRNGSGLLSAAQTIIVADPAKVNGVAPVTADAARYGASVAPESIATAFGTSLASQNISAAGLPLPISLDGTTVYVNGLAAPLFYVSPSQINFQVPPGTLPGTAKLVVVAKDGTISQGQLTVAPLAPGLFTMKSDGTGTPIGVATADAVNFVSVGNPNGTPRPLDAGLYVSLFGTGFRFALNSDLDLQNGSAEAVTLTLGGVTVPVLFSGSQGQFAGLDQLNFQIPITLAGRGDVDLVMTVGGKTANTVKLNIK